MTLTYSLTEDDYLQLQLFIASKSERVKKLRKRRRIWVTAIFFIAAIAFCNSFDRIFFYYFLVLAIVSAFFHRNYTAYLYKKHYKKYVADVHKNSFNETINVMFTDEILETADRSGTSKINLPEMEVFSETGSYFYLKLKTGSHLIIPKAQLHNNDEIRTLLINLSKKLNINFLSDLNWKWK